MRALTGFFVAAGALLLIFSPHLLRLFRFSMESELYSHLALIPAASLYFLWLQRAELPPLAAPDRQTALGAAFGALVLLVLHWSGLTGGTASAEDQLAAPTLAFLLSLVAACAWFLGRPRTRALAFPLGFLLFLVPLPTALLQMVETVLQYGSAATAHGFLSLVGTPVYREDLVFILPGFSMHVAPQCSGIRSTLALLITAVAAGQLFLQRPWKRLVLALVVLPLALVRNGFRIFVIGELCVRISPDMIDSYVHRQGGPIFFGLSLIPFSALLYALYRSERVRLSSARP